MDMKLSGISDRVDGNMVKNKNHNAVWHFGSMDWVQVAAVLSSFTGIVLSSVYYDIYGHPNKVFVSDVLFDLVSYKVLMTVFVCAQAVFAMLFSFRFADVAVWYVCAMALTVSATLSGWVLLNSVFKSPDGETSNVHNIGALLFMVGSGLFSALLVLSVRLRVLIVLQCEATMDFGGLLSACALVSLILCASFCIAFIFRHNDYATTAWAYEHASLISLPLTHFFFFLVESPNPLITISASLKESVTFCRDYVPTMGGAVKSLLMGVKISSRAM